MNDALLRLARIVTHIASDTYDWKDLRVDEAAQLVRDLEAAPPPRETRTITREEYGSGIEVLVRIGTVHKRDVDELLSRWRLTVEG